MAAEQGNGAAQNGKANAQEYLRIVDVRKEFDGFVAVDDTKLDAEKSDLWTVAWDGGAPVQLTKTPANSEWQPRYGADGLGRGNQRGDLTGRQTGVPASLRAEPATTDSQPCGD